MGAGVDHPLCPFFCCSAMMEVGPDNSHIGFRPIQGQELVMGGPLYGPMFCQHNVAAGYPANKGMKPDTQIRIRMARWREQSPDLDVNAQFFANLPDNAVFCGFSRVDFSTGELPLKGHSHSGAALGCQNLSVFLYERAGDIYEPTGIS